MMKTRVVDGRSLAGGLLAELASRVHQLKRAPLLAIVLVGDDPASKVYVNIKRAKAAKIGINTKLVHLERSVGQDFLVGQIESLNFDPEVDGIIVQLPLPAHINALHICAAIDPTKDVDGLHPINLGKLYAASSYGVDSDFFAPCTALAAIHVLSSLDFKFEGSHVVIVNRSVLIGKPLAALLLQRNSTVTICHSRTKDLRLLTQTADAVICAVGQPNFFDKSYFCSGAFVLDIGISKVLENDGAEHLVGDVQDVTGHAGCITPVVGGVGPLTVAYLLSNTVDAACKKLSDI